MRILYLLHNVSWTGGGIFFTAYHQGRHLAARGHEVTLVSISPSARWGFSECISAGVRMIETPDWLWGKARTGWDLWDTVRRIGFLRNGKYDLVHGYESRPVVALPALYLKHTHGIPLVFTWADWFGSGGKGDERGRWLGRVMGPVENFCEEYFYPRADYCVAMGEPLSARARSLGIPQGRILNLLHGCDSEGILPMTIQEARSRLTQLPHDGIVLGYLGVMRPSTAEILFEAFRLIRKQFAGPCKLVLIGNHKLRLSNYISPDCVEDVIETGWLSYEKVNLYLASADLLLLPLKRAIATDNVWPSKLNDYLAVGRAIVATDMRVLAPIFDQHQVGWLTRDTAKDFAEGCLCLLDDATERRRLGENARALAEGELSWNQVVDHLENFYSEIVWLNNQ